MAGCVFSQRIRYENFVYHMCIFVDEVSLYFARDGIDCHKKNILLKVSEAIVRKV